MKSKPLRVKGIIGLFIFVFIAIAGRMVYLQLFRGDFLQNYANRQYYRLIPLEAKRGKIFDRKERILAIGLQSYSVYADPLLIINKKEAAEKLAMTLDLSQEILKAKLAKEKRFVWIKRRIPWDIKEEITSLKIKGIGFLREDRRLYPQEDLAASVLGIVDIDNKGLEGLELNYDKYLKGKDGWVRILKDSSSRQVLLTPQSLTPQKGADLVLTLDAQLQYWVEEELKSAVEQAKAKSGSVILMDSTNGEILAMANYPGFNPNALEAKDTDNIKNRAISDMFEPGSVFKVVTLIAAIESEQFKDDDQFFCENGRYKIPGTILHDWKPYGDLTFTEVFKNSSNIGVGKIAAQLGALRLYEQIKKLRFAEKTGIDLPGEIKGTIKPTNRWSKTSLYMVPIGQEVGVTLIQMVRLFASVANGGYLVRPHIVKSIFFPAFAEAVKVKKEKVLAKGVSARARKILFEVVEDGTGKKAKVKGVLIGGKTGTAQKFDPAIGRYSKSKYRASFVGFISSIKRPVVLAVSIDEPIGLHTGGSVGAPLFGRIVTKIVNYMETEQLLEDVNN